MSHISKIRILVVTFLVAFAVRAQHFERISYTLPNLPSLDNYTTFIDHLGNAWIYSEDGVVKYNFTEPKHFTVQNGLKTNDVWGMQADYKHRIWLSYYGKGLRYIYNDSVFAVKPAEKYSDIHFVSQVKDTVYFECFDPFSKDYHKQFYLTGKGEFGRWKDKNILRGRLVASYKSRGIEVRTKAGVTTAYYPDGSKKVLPFGVVLDNPSTMFYHDDQKILFRPNVPLNELQFFVDGKFIRKKLRDHLNGVPVHIFCYNKSYSALVEINNELRFYKNLYTKERDYKIEAVIDSYYKRYGFGFMFTIGEDGNYWLTLNRGKVLFIPVNYQGVQQVDFETEAQTGPSNYIELIKTSNGFVAATRKHELVFIDKELKQKSLIYSNQPCRMVKYNYGKVGVLNYDFFQYYDLETKAHRGFKIGEFKYSFDWISPCEVVFSNGSVLDIITGKWKSKAFHIHSKIKRLNATKKYFFLTGIENIRVLERKTGKLVFFKEQAFTKRIKTIGKYTYLIMERGGVLVFDENAKLVKHVLANYDVVDVLAWGGKTIFFTKYDLYVYSRQYRNGEELVRLQKISLNLNFQGLQIQRAQMQGDFVLLGTNNGLLRLDLTRESPIEKQNLRVEITGLVQKDKIDVPSFHQYFESKENDIVFKVHVNSFSTFGKVNYFYRLKGYENFYKRTNQNNFNYTSLPPGKYTFQVFADNGVAVSKNSEISFEILPKFYETLWFIMSIVIVFVLFVGYLVYVIFKYRQKVLTKKNKLVELEFQALKTQLNPHFIFNSLHTLQAILFQKDDEAANNYLVSLSVLMRTVLTNARTSTISIKKEIDFLESYVNIQSVKMDSEINFNVFLLGIDRPEKLFIRNMILQPFVENAIVHGLTHKEGSKRIDLTFTREGQYVRVSIKDNGIGRVAAAKINERIKKDHQSLGSAILQEKSDLINQIYNENLHFYFEDLEDEFGAKGTVVHIVLKLIEE